MSFSPDGRALASASKDGSIALYSVAKGVDDADNVDNVIRIVFEYQVINEFIFLFYFIFSKNSRILINMLCNYKQYYAVTKKQCHS